MQYAALLRKSLASSRHLAASRLSFSIRAPASMASASSDLYRTTSASTASSSGGPEMYITASTSAADSPRRKLNRHASRSSLHDGQQSGSETSKKRRQPKKKVPDNKSTTTSSSSSCLPGFVAATSLTSSRQSPAVATSLDVKGKGRASDSDGRPAIDQKESNVLTMDVDLSNDLLQSGAVYGNDTTPITPSLVSNTVSDKEGTSPQDSAASSTDELPYSPSPTVSPRVIPQKKMAVRDSSVTPKSSPFKAPLTGFHFLAARNLAVEERSFTAVVKPNAEGLGIAGTGLENMPVLQHPATAPPATVQENRSAPLDPAKKRITSSPLTWSSDHKVFDAPTLGSPTLGSMIETEDSQELARNAITKAAFSVSQATILQELAKRKAQSKASMQQTSEAQYTPPSLRQPEEITEKQKEQEEISKTGPEDGVKRKDMAVPQSQRLSPRSNMASTLNGSLDMPAPSSALDRSPLPGDGTTSATADIEDDIDDGASDASITSHLMHSVVRDADSAGGWEALDASYSTKDKARHRLQSAIYELNKRHRPSEAVISARQEMLLAIRKRLNLMLKDWAPDFQYNLETFGSTKYGLDTDSSDLDLCIVDPYRPDGFRDVRDLYDLTVSDNGVREAIASTEEDEEHSTSTPFSRHKKNNKEWTKPETRKRMSLANIYDVQRLADTLRRMGHQQVIAIPNAIVPIVKFKSRAGIKADMLGVRNSTLIAEYISMKPIVRPYLIFLKVWAKQRHINDPSGQKGLMSLSSYSLVLMAIAYLQHAGIVPNLQDADLINMHGVAREVFWSKVPNPDAPKASHWTKRKYLGDYKAMAIDTTFVRAEKLDSQAERVVTSSSSPTSATTKKKGTANFGSIGSIGWESESDVQYASEETSNDESMEILRLIEGFFEYYLGFPTENKAVSVWRGKPIDRKRPYQASSHSPRKLSKAIKALRAAQSENSDSEGSDLSGERAEKNGHSSSKTPTRLSDSETSPTSEATTVTEDEELRALYEKLDGKMRKLGISDEGPSFELTLKSKKQKKRRSQPNGGADSVEQVLPAMREIDALEALAEADAVGPANNAHKGLEAWQASPETNLFPVPPVEDPEKFISPPTWTQLLIVQDPFIHTRNTTMNIVPETVSLIWKEMERALKMVKTGEPLNKICSNMRHEPSYKRKAQFRSHREVERRRAVRVDSKAEGRIQKQRHRKRSAHRSEKSGREGDVKAT